MVRPLQLQELWNELYSRKGIAWLTVLSGSMSPMIQIGDRILVKYVTPKQVHLGDIVVFKEMDRLITHRIIDRQIVNHRIVFLQKGDSNTFASELFAENVIGKVIRIEKKGKCIKLDRFWGKEMNQFLGICFHILYVLRRYCLASRLNWLFRSCLNILLGNEKLEDKAAGKYNIVR